jgi:site-specific DNA-methyltransferase (adenine-specific)
MLELNADYSEDNIQLFNKDCLDVLKQIPDNSIDLVVTDPPYKVISGGNKSEKWKSGYSKSVLFKNDGKIFDFNNIDFNDWIPEIYRILKPATHFYCMTNTINIAKILQVCEDVGFKLHNILVWEKNTANANRWYMKNCEFTLFFRKGESKTINNPSSKMVHHFNNIIGNKTHPTEKPVELMKFYIENSSNIDDLVLDPFMGSGSTVIACKESNRKCIGIEIDTKYFDTAKDRLIKHKCLPRVLF